MTEEPEMSITYRPLDPALVKALRAGGPDAYGAAPERLISDGGGLPCRACLADIPAGKDALVLAHRPFEETQPYAETGPIFICADCAGTEASAMPPPAIAARAEFLVKGYTADNRIKYGTGKITPTDELDAYCRHVFADPDVEYIHVRSSTNNCFFCRVERAEGAD